MKISVVRKVIFENNGYYVLLTDFGTVVGELGNVEKGKCYKFYGKKSWHKRYGDNFKAEKAERYKPPRPLSQHDSDCIKKFDLMN